MEKLNKHGLPIMKVNMHSHKKVSTIPGDTNNPYFCKGLYEQLCNNKGVNIHGQYKYCDRCYAEIVGYGNHAFE